MDESKARAKAAKKQSKARLKLEKKRGGKGAIGPQPSDHVADLAAGDRRLLPAERSANAAERSAAAAERQAALQRYRVLFASAMVLIALATLIATTKPWRWISTAEPTSQAPDPGRDDLQQPTSEAKPPATD